MQTNKSLIFDKHNMSLSGQSINCLEKGLAKRIENLSCNNGCLKSVNIADDLFEKIEPQKSELLRNKFLEKGDCLWITIYSTIQDAVEVNYVVFCTTDYRVYYYNSQDESPAVKELIPVPFSSEPIFEYFLIYSTFCSLGRLEFLILSITTSLQSQDEEYSCCSFLSMNNGAATFPIKFQLKISKISIKLNIIIFNTDIMGSPF